MPNDSVYEIKKDANNESLYYSRNNNDIRHQAHGSTHNRSNEDWATQLRMMPIKRYAKEKTVYSSPEGAPNFSPSRDKPSNTEEFAPEDPYDDNIDYVRSAKQERGGGANLAHSGGQLGKGDPMQTKQLRASNSGSVLWSMNLREYEPTGNNRFKQEKVWKRNYTRSVQSLDIMAEEVKKPGYEDLETIPEIRRQDPCTSAIPIANLRANSDYNMEGKGSGPRSLGCEGAQTSTWRNIIEDKRQPGSRVQAGWASMLRDPGHRDNRDHAHRSQLMGRKKWSKSTNTERTTLGDPKLRHLNFKKPLPEDRNKIHKPKQGPGDIWVMEEMAFVEVEA